MSLLPPQATFHERVQDLFAAFRGRGVSLSALDVELLDAWAGQGAPFEVVARGIRRAAETVLFDAAADSRGLSSLAACRRSVESEINRYLRQTVGQNSAAFAPAPEPFHVKQFKKRNAALKKAALEVPQHQGAIERLLRLAPPRDLDACQLQENFVYASLIRALPYSDRRALLQQARHLVQKAPPMSLSARLESLRLHRFALLRQLIPLRPF